MYYFQIVTQEVCRPTKRITVGSECPDARKVLKKYAAEEHLELSKSSSPRPRGYIYYAYKDARPHNIPDHSRYNIGIEVTRIVLRIL